MQLRIARVRRGTKTYEYAQLVESYRREADGMPAHRVVANLGTLSAEQVGNLKVALQASREGKRVVLPKTPKQDGSTANPRTLKPLDNLRYLDLAVLLELWKQWKLGPLLDELMPA